MKQSFSEYSDLTLSSNYPGKSNMADQTSGAKVFDHKQYANMRSNSLPKSGTGSAIFIVSVVSMHTVSYQKLWI